MKELNRTKVGIFDIQDSIKLEELNKNKENEKFLNEHIISIENLFKRLYGDKNKIVINSRKIELYLNGTKLTQTVPDGQYRVYDENNNFIGTGSVQNKLLKREIVVGGN